MDFKVLIKLYVPEIEEVYEMFIPVNRTIGEVSLLLCKLINDISKVYPVKENLNLCNRYSNVIYDNRELVRNTDIRNGTELVIF